MEAFIETEDRWLRVEILPKILKNGRLVNNYSDQLKDTFKVDSIDIKRIGTDEAYMLTQCYRATVNFKYANEKVQTKLVVKKTPVMPKEVYDSIQFDDLFKNEIQFYTRILPELEKISGNKLVAPKYYYSDHKPGFAVIILEDFALDDWTIPKDKVGLNLEHARVAVNYLAEFHGLCYSLKHNDNNKFLELISELKDARFGDKELIGEFDLRVKTSKQRTLKATRKYQPLVDEDFAKKWVQLTMKTIEYGRQRVAPREPLATLCHGDFLRNNLAYKYDANDGVLPVKAMMFDFQTMRFSSPMIDLGVFLALSLFAEVRYKHFDSIFDEYCSTLAQSYKKHSKKSVPEYLRRETLIKEYIRFLPFTLSITAYFLMTMVNTTGECIEDMLLSQHSDQETIVDAMNRGGEIVDREIAHQVKEMYELSKLYNVEIDDDIVI